MTRLLLDTHFVLWWLNDDPRLPATVMERQSDGEPRDPFDRLLVCQRRLEPLLLLAVVSQLRRHGGTVIVLGDESAG